MRSVPAIVVDSRYSETEKAQQFLVENVARLKMRPVDRALLIRRARESGEETSSIANRFGVSSATVRRLLAQLDGMGAGEMAALRDGDVSLGMHSVVARHVPPTERLEALSVITTSGVKIHELETLFSALDWRRLVQQWPGRDAQRLALLTWACSEFTRLPNATRSDRLAHLALHLPVHFAGEVDQSCQVSG